MTLYIDHMRGLMRALEALNELEKATPNEPTAMYLAGPIPVHLDGEPVGFMVNEIGDEWCYTNELPRAADTTNGEQE